MIKVYCFGNTQNGELGLGGIEDEQILIPRKQRLPFDRRKYSLVQLSSGRNHTILLLRNIQLDQNFVFSCGSNERSQLGRSGSWKKLEQVDNLDHHNIVKISCGFNNCLALSDNGQLFSWGCNLFGQLGLGSREEQEVAKPVLVKLLATKQIIQISCGGNHCLVLTKIGEVYSWGSNAFGQLGLGTSGNCLSTPMLLTSLKWTPVRQVIAGGSHSAVLSCTGSIYVWGKNEFGQLGLGDVENRSLPTLQKCLRNQRIAYMSLGDEHSAALTFEGGLFTWGAGMYGQLGHGRNSNEVLPRQVFELMGQRLVQVSCGRCHTLVATKMGRVYSFGLNGSGQLGIGTTTSKFLPTPVRGPWGEINEKDVILRDGDRSVLLIDPSEEEEEKEKVQVKSEELRKLSMASSKNAEDLEDMEIDEISEQDETATIDDSKFIIEEPDEQSSSEKLPKFIAADDAVFQRKEVVEIDEYETDPDSDWEEGPVRKQFIVKEVIASKGDQSFVMVQLLSENTSPRDLRTIVPEEEILKLQNDVFESFQTFSKYSVPLEIIDYLESTFSSVPAINASYFSVKSTDDYPSANAMKKFKKHENINSDEIIDFKDGCIHWQQAFHGFNTIEGVQNEKINDLIYQNILKLLQDMPDLSLKNRKTKPEHFPEVLDEETLRIYQIMPLFHMFKNTSYSEQSQKLISAFSQAILNLSPLGISCLKIWWCKMDRRFFKNFIEIFKNNVKINLLAQAEEIKNQNTTVPDSADNSTTPGSTTGRMRQIKYDVHLNLARGLQVLKMLYTVNKFTEKISYKNFYIEGIHDMFDLKLDYCMWKKNHAIVKEPKEYYLCDFPFIFDLAAKNIILNTDSELQQHSAAQVSMQKQFLMHPRRPGETVTLDPYFKISVRRDHLLEDTVNQLCLLHYHQGEDLKKPLRVYFEGEEAVDAGQGMKKEFFLLLMKELLDEKYGMFTVYEETNTIWFNHYLNTPEDENMYRLIGILCGLAIYNQVIIDLPFPLTLYKKILGEQLELEDLAYLDPILTKNLQDILNTPYGREEFDSLFGELTFVITLKTFGHPTEYELCPDGKTRRLNFENREEYVELYWKFLLITSVEKQFGFFYSGFSKVLDQAILKIFQAEELMQLIEGDEVVNWEELESATNYKEEFNKDHPTIKLFWKVFYSFTTEEKKKFLKFLTGSDRIPTTGVKALNLTIQPMKVSEEHLPVAHTCFNILDLPLEYTSDNKEEIMRSKLLKAAELAVEFALV